jgi:DNA-directed RNA polymerase I subunit RPA12
LFLLLCSSGGTRDEKESFACFYNTTTTTTKTDTVDMTAPCTRCGYTIYLQKDEQIVRCEACDLGLSTKKLFGEMRTETRSQAKHFLYKFDVEPKNPDGTKIGKNSADDLVQRERAEVNEPCPKCDNDRLRFYTMQLRSADEGQTVFYECEKCKFTFSQNN